MAPKKKKENFNILNSVTYKSYIYYSIAKFKEIDAKTKQKIVA